MDDKVILGIWDGHDAGAAVVAGGEVLFAVNEERLTRRKLEVGFPRRSIEACLSWAGLPPGEVRYVAASTTDPAKTLTRLLPRLKERYYLLRRRKLEPRWFHPLQKGFKYRFTELGPNALSRWLSRRWLKGRLAEMGFGEYDLGLIDHHLAHAAAAAACCGFAEALVFTLDGVGDGLCGSFWRWQGGRLTLLKALPARTSLGIFFEHVTNLLNMRELEDEGKVMALADYAYPVPDEENPLLGVIAARGLGLFSPYRSTEMLRVLRRVLWRYPSEQFAFMAQRVLERCACNLAQEAMQETGLRRLAVCGGVFSNIKMNMALARLPDLDGFYVFPHMGDGGLGLGAALAVQKGGEGLKPCRLSHLYLGPCFSSAQIEEALEKGGGVFRIRRVGDPAAEAARLILSGEIVLWFRGRMEVGPRALGHRSILARPDDREIRDRLNVLLKKRVWYQPFCPSILKADAPSLLEVGGLDIAGNPFMTMAYRVRTERRGLLAGVISRDGTCRPQFVGDEEPCFSRLLGLVKESLGYGVVLNTSLNLHGEPLVCAPAEALAVLSQTGIRYLVMEDVIVENRTAERR